MKRSIIAFVIGLAAVNAFGQGGIVFNNSAPVPGSDPAQYNPVFWIPGTPGVVGGSGVRSDQGVTLRLWYGAGVVGADALQGGPTLTWNSQFEAAGFYGYYDPITVYLDSWTTGQTYSFQIRATFDSSSGPMEFFVSRSVVWQEQANILFVANDHSLPPGFSDNRIGFGIGTPEPSTIALAALGLGSLLFFRQRS